MSGQSLSLGKFELIEVMQVNEGFAVALCYDPQNKLNVICKTASTSLPSDEQIASLRREHELASKAQGPGVIKLLGLEKSETGCPILVFERFQGSRLEMGENPLPTAESLPLFIQIAKALGHIHSKKIIHRDLNPDNILWDRKSREICIIDFNLATDILNETVRSDSIESLCGTLPFISPEQTGRMNRKVDFRSDYYSLGMTFYQVLAGRSPFEAHDAMGWVYCHITEQPPLLSDKFQHVPLALAKVIDKMLAKNAEDRYQSSFGLIRDLELIAAARSSDDLNSFDAGRFDVSEWLTIPEKLYGREHELTTFLSFFDRVRAGEKFMCIISGSSGMGKSVLVNEINKPVIEARGNFIAGKCDQYKRNMPYSAIKPAFADLIRQYLAKTPEEVESIRQQILDRIGDSVQVIAEIIPELEALTGPLKPVSKLPPTEARMRFQKAFEVLLKIFTADGKPLVAFLDDLQWSDLPSLKLIEYLMLEADLSSFMIAAVFRDNEVQAGHPLLLSLDEIRKLYEIPSIKLSPLAKNSIAQLLSDAFRCAFHEVLELADILYSKTAGNPFHITEMIKTLHESTGIFFDANEGKWRWNVRKINEAGISNDVVELMVATLLKCSKEAQARLKIAACIGAQFDLSILSSVCELSEYQVLDDLWPTIEKGLIIPLGESYKLLKSGMSIENKHFLFKFQHDRVHEAAYLLIQENQRPAAHLHIGRLLRKKLQGKELENQIVEIVRHYNLAVGLIEDSAENLDVCHLNLLAAIKNRNSVAYDASLHHLQLARKYLPGDFWKEHYSLALKVHMNLSELAFLVGDFDLVERTNQELLNRVTDVLDRAEVQSMRIDQNFSQGHSMEARTIGVQSLHDLGLKFPAKPNKLTILKLIFSMKRRLKKINLDRVMDGKRLEDRKIQLILRQLVALNPIFFAMADRTASGVCVLENLRLSIEHGISAESAYGFGGSASIFGNLLGNLPLGNKLGMISLDIADSFAVASIKPAIYHIYTSFIAPFNVELEKMSEYVDMTIEAGLAAGDLYFLPIAATLSQTYSFSTGLSEVCEKDEKYYLHLTKNSNNQKCQALNLFLHRYRRSLLEKPNTAQTDRYLEQDQKALQIFEQDRFLIGNFVFSTYSAAMNYMLGDMDSAYQHIKDVSRYFLAARGTFHETDYHFFNLIIISQVWPKLARAEQKAAFQRAQFSLKRMKLISSHQPANFLYKYQVMQAEILAIKGRLHESLELCEQALDDMKRNIFRDVGIINEICARRYLLLNKKRIAQIFIRDSYNAFRAWQAEHKAEQLLEQWPVLKQDLLAAKNPGKNATMQSRPSTTGTNRGLANHSLDMLTITRASQTLSSQVEMASLVQHLMKIIVENAGAHFAVLMLKDKGKSPTRVVATILNNDTKILENQSLSDFHELSLSIMLYTTRVNETVIVDDVEKDEKYRSDPYIQKTRPKAILAMPITLKGQAIGYFYLENRLMAGSFTADRVEVLNILGTQAAISLENAQLYSSLENKVRERTSQLAEKNRDIRSILTNIKQGILTVMPGTLVHAEYSQYLESILETKDIAHQNLMRLMFAKSRLSSDVQDQIRGAIDFSLEQDELCFESNENLLIKEFVRENSNGELQYLEIDWDPMVNSEKIVEKIMVTVRDVTEVKRLREISERSRLELTMLSQILNAGSERYQKFMANAHGLLLKTQDLITRATPEDQETLNVAYRHLHTVKGNARLLAFTELTSLVHECESILMHLKTQSMGLDPARADVLGYISRILSTMQSYQRVYAEKLLAYTATGQSARAARIAEKISQKAQLWERSYPEVSRELSVLIGALDAQTLDDILMPLRANTEEMAREMGKEAPRFHVDGSETSLNEGEANLLTNIFVHLLSNAIHHGIEDSLLRQKAGKASFGTIFISVREKPNQRVYTIHDDGKGLDLAAIRARAIMRNLIGPQDHPSDHELAMMIFKSGLSTAEAVSQSAGRGVGMDAILDMVREAGGYLELILDPNSPAPHQTFKIEIGLPIEQAQSQRSAA